MINKVYFLFRCMRPLTLLLVLASCSQMGPPQTSATPTVAPSKPVGTPTLPSTPTATPLGGASAKLGLVPKDCPAGPTPKDVISNTGPAAGGFPVWAVGFGRPHATLEWNPQQAMELHYSDGWHHKFLWVVDTSVNGLVTIHGANLYDGSPFLPDAEQKVATSTPTTLILDPQDPNLPNIIGSWAEFPGGLDIPKAGCYYLIATWPGGSWRITFAAGVVPS